MRFCLALIFAPAIASAQTMDAGTSSTADGGPPDAGGCGDITFEGECQGNMVVYCESDEIVTIDCPVEYGPTAICQEIDPFYGVDCALAAGETCIYEDGAEFLTDFCQGNAAGCVETAEDSSCQANVGTCTADEIRTCRGAQLIYDCNVNQPWLVDCASFLGTCIDDHCEVPGGVCDDDVLVCQEGKFCGALGLCETVSVDAGVPDSGASLDAGTGGDDDGCVCTSDEAGIPHLLLLVIACFIVRRRGR